MERFAAELRDEAYALLRAPAGLALDPFGIQGGDRLLVFGGREACGRVRELLGAEP